MTVTYHGRLFRPDGAGGTDHPVGRYHEDGDVVFAEFAGAWLRLGHLVGYRRTDGSIDATYCLAMADGELVAGRCHSVPEVLPDGRLRIADHWQRLDGSSGVSYIEEIPRTHAEEMTP